MQRIPKSKYAPIRCTKKMAQLIRQAERGISEEAEKQVDLCVCSMVIALYKYWGYREDRISKIINLENEIFNECGSDNNLSMIRMCDEECDIELTNCEGISYRDKIFLNAEIDDGKPLTSAQWLAMRQNQKKWVEAQIMACMFIAMHRKEGWGFKRLSELGTKMAAIKAEADYNPEKIRQMAKEQADFTWTGDFDDATG
jgi:hypothetical protein